MALHALLQNPNLECRTLLTSISQEFQRVSMHGLPRALVEKQAQALELPIRWMELPPNTTMESYDRILKNTVEQLKL